MNESKSTQKRRESYILDDESQPMYMSRIQSNPFSSTIVKNHTPSTEVHDEYISMYTFIHITTQAELRYLQYKSQRSSRGDRNRLLSILDPKPSRPHNSIPTARSN